LIQNIILVSKPRTSCHLFPLLPHYHLHAPPTHLKTRNHARLPPPKADLTQPASALAKQNITKCGASYIYIEQPTSQAASSRAIDKDGKLYTIKLLKDSRARDEEYKIQHRVTSHDTIINIYEKCEFGGSHAILMEYVTGETVAKKASAGLYKNEGAAKKAFAGILDAVEHVHSKDAAHLDIRGSNIVVGAQDVVKLGGFGKATLNGEMDKIDVTGGIRSPGT
jgi:serine/threonine protein kinase